MSGILGFEFYLGPEVPPPLPIDYTLIKTEIISRRIDWYELIEEAVRDNDAWAVLVTQPNCDVVLYDVSKDRLLEATAHGGTCHLLLGKKASTNGS